MSEVLRTEHVSVTRAHGWWLVEWWEGSGWSEYLAHVRCDTLDGALDRAVEVVARQGDADELEELLEAACAADGFGITFDYVWDRDGLRFFEIEDEEED